MNVTGVVDVSHQFRKGNSPAELAGSLPVLTHPGRPLSPKESLPRRRRAERPSPFSLLFLVVSPQFQPELAWIWEYIDPFTVRELILGFQEVLAQE